MESISGKMKMQRTRTIGDANSENATELSIHSMQAISIEPEADACPHIDSLPPEILSEIFLLALPSSYNILDPIREGPWLLGRVCHRWRDISRDYPALWSSFDLVDWQLGQKQLAQEIGLRMLQEALQRTRESRLTMTLWIHDSFPPAIIETLMQHSRQWEDVDLLFCSSHQWTQLILNSPSLQFPSLKSLSLCYKKYTDDLATTLGMFKNAPNLRSLEFDVRMHSFDMGMIPFPWSQITRLTMSFAMFSHMELIVSLLRLCPSLEELTEMTLLHRDPEVATIAPLTLSKLRSLSLGYSHLLLGYLICPVLEHLSFTMPHADYPSSNLTISQFFARSRSQLQSLKLKLQWHTLDPDQLFSCIPQLRKLVLLLADSENDRDPARFLKGLSGERGVMLPNLSVLELSATNIFTDDYGKSNGRAMYLRHSDS
ncbi:hypothetical protein ARMSODRAFT_1091095 [Armillaria solidipes]|uniref:Uncharacterized protein n=1 Tax=Armillaria solidipes TaxID=1076256 RepID=A0A2H3B6X0_9AGAR|nr:hypothetical protein ARMSODRAFT_1091095 [Armillaria solidipes]